MPSVNLDLPQEALDEVARLAQQLNVHRVDVFVQAVAKLAQSFALEQELSLLREHLAAARESTGSLDRRVRDQEADLARLGDDLGEARDEAAAARRDRASLLQEIAAIRTAAAGLAEERQKLADERNRAAARAREMEEQDRRKTLDVMRDAEVEKVRRHAQEIAVQAQKLEEDLEYQRMDAGLKAKRIESLSRRLSSASRMKKRFETDLTRQRKELFQSERQIGLLLRDRAKLRGELRQLGRILSRGELLKPTKTVRKPGSAEKKS